MSLRLMEIKTFQKKNIPDTPGVYYFKKGKKVLYVGKATSLRNRVKSYFQGDILGKRSPLIAKMVKEASALVFKETESALEALILEAQEIKKYQPVYNSKEKDNKSFNYVVITDEQFPRVLVVRQRELLQKKLPTIRYEFGPFPSGKSLKEALRIIRKIFPFRDAPSNRKHHERFYAQLGLLPDVSDSEVLKVYKRNIQHIRMFFEGKKKKIRSQLERQMKLSARAEKFEEAQRIKKQLFALDHIQDVSLVSDDFVGNGREDISYRVEAYDVAHTSGKEVVGVMTVVDGGEVQKDQYRKFIIRDNPGNNDVRALKEIVERRLGHTEWPLPRVMVADGGLAQKRAIEGVLHKNGVEIPVVSVVKDEHHRPKGMLGVTRYEKDVLLANAEAHRFAIGFHKKKRDAIN